MTEWVKVNYYGNWICVRDHPDAKLTSYRDKYLFSIITSNNMIEIGANLIVRDFLEITD